MKVNEVRQEVANKETVTNEKREISADDKKENKKWLMNRRK